jgi:hypothetical protein
VAFFDNEAQQQSGQYAFHFARDAYSEEDVPGSLTRMLTDRVQERALLEAKQAAMANHALVKDRQIESPSSDLARQEVLNAAELMYNRSVYELSESRREVNLLERQVDRLKVRLVQQRKDNGGLPPEAAAQERARLEEELAAAEKSRDLQMGPAQLRMNEAETNKVSLYNARKWLAAGTEPGEDADPGTRSAYSRIVSSVRDSWRARLDEQAVETDLLKRHRELAAKLNGRKMVALVVWGIRPDPRRWTILGPDVTPNSIANLQVTRWIKDYAQTNYPGCDGLVSGLESPSAAGIGGRVSFALELGSIGVAPASRLPPAEPEPDLEAFGAHAAEALAFCRELVRQPDLSRVRIPARLNAALVFNIPAWSESGRYDGCFTRQYDDRSKAGAPIADAPVFIQNRKINPLPTPDSWGGAWVSSSKAGTFPIMAVRGQGYLIQSALYDGQGRITAISQRHADGTLGMAGNWEQPSWFFPEANNQIVLSDVRSRIRVAGIRSPTGIVADNTVKFWDSNTSSKPKRLNLSLARTCCPSTRAGCAATC